MKYLVLYDSGVFTDTVGRAFQTPGKPDIMRGMATFMYAVDEYGNMFASPKVDTDDLVMNHSSFNAGKDVFCAGEVGINDGRLLFIDNLSGHYKPTAENMQNLLKLFESEGVDLSETTVVESQAGGMAKIAKATDFVRNIHCGGKLVPFS